MTKKPADSAKMRTLRIGVLGPSTARCEKCTADCSKTIGEWAIDGLCRPCADKKR